VKRTKSGPKRTSGHKGRLGARQPFTGARPVVTTLAWRASAERPGFPAVMEGRNFFRPSEEVSHAAIIHPW
jgi:hypothetical protein